MRQPRVTYIAVATWLAAGSTAAAVERAAPDPAASMVFLIAALAGYFLPALIAGARSHQSAGPIFLLNLFLGWTFVGWVAALVWSSTQVRRDPDAAPADGGKRCPQCAEVVQKAARVCRYCGHSFEG